jgi:sulfocyanin
VLGLAVPGLAAAASHPAPHAAAHHPTFHSSTRHRKSPASRWLAWNAKTHTATLTLIAGYNNALGGFNFNGYGDGKMVIGVPVGTHVAVHFSNKGQVAHSTIFTPYARRTSTSGFPLAFRGASTTDPTSGIMPGQAQRLSFVASKTGTYALVCGVPGHEAAGMWDVFKVTAGGRPSITTH